MRTARTARSGELAVAALVLSPLAFSGCVTPRLVSEAKAIKGDILLRRIDEPRSFYWFWDGKDPALDPRRVVRLDPPFPESACESVVLYVNPYTAESPISPKSPRYRRIKAFSVEAPLLPTQEFPPCSVVVTFGEIRLLHLKGFVASTEAGPFREIPLKGNPWLWPVIALVAVPDGLLYMMGAGLAAWY